MSRSFRFIHSFGIEFIILKTELLENRLIVWDIEDSKNYSVKDIMENLLEFQNQN